MALIICPECGKEISDKASICIHCGYPISKKENNNYEFSCKVDNKLIDLTYLERSINTWSQAEKEDLYNHCKWIFEDWIHPGATKPSFNSTDNIQIALNAGNITNSVNKFFNWDSKNKKSILSYKFITLCIENNFNNFNFNTSDYINISESQKPTVASQQPTIQQPTSSNVVRCPRCGSTSVTAEKRGFDPIWGFLGSDWVKYNVCQKCGHRWKIGR